MDLPQPWRSGLNAAAPPHAALSADTGLALTSDRASGQNACRLSSPAERLTPNVSPEWRWGECQGSHSRLCLVGTDVQPPEYACRWYLPQPQVSL